MLILTATRLELRTCLASYRPHGSIMKLLDWVLVTRTSLCDEKKYIVPEYKTNLSVNRSLAVTEKRMFGLCEDWLRSVVDLKFHLYLHCQ